ncbi:hypothetical protein [Mesorhizobium sp. CA14]|nr:hypothetical protein [Mesorhizobium sp. CA14]
MRAELANEYAACLIGELMHLQVRTMILGVNVDDASAEGIEI